ncbi:MAG: histidine kinase [Microscillaceae bacterium]|nr:histidine kinase [Microscillaceae bacterium]
MIRTVIFFQELPLWLLLTMYPISIISILLTWTVFKKIHQFLDRQMPYHPKKLIYRVLAEVLLGTSFMWVYMNIMLWLNDTYLNVFIVERKLRMAAYISGALGASLINAGFIGYHYFQEWKNTLLKAEKLEKEKSQVQFDNLRNQLNPHFLFNSLTSLNSLIFENQELASQFLQQLSKVFRYLLQNKDKDLVSLKTELEFVKNYIFLLETRFNNTLKIKIQIPDNQLDKRIVPVTTQILIENAIKHNSIGEGKPLQIDLTVIEDYLIIRNNRQKKTLVETSNKQGLENLKNLYTFLTDKQLDIQEDSEYFLVKIPLL